MGERLTHTSMAESNSSTASGNEVRPPVNRPGVPITPIEVEALALNVQKQKPATAQEDKAEIGPVHDHTGESFGPGDEKLRRRPVVDKKGNHTFARTF